MAGAALLLPDSYRLFPKHTPSSPLISLGSSSLPCLSRSSKDTPLSAQAADETRQPQTLTRIHLNSSSHLLLFCAPQLKVPLQSSGHLLQGPQRALTAQTTKTQRPPEKALNVPPPPRQLIFTSSCLAKPYYNWGWSLTMVELSLCLTLKQLQNVQN